MRPVATDDQFSGHRCSVAQCCLDGIRALIEFLNASVEAVVGLILGRLVQHIDQVAAQDLEFGDEAVAVECRHRHLGPPTAIGFDPGDATLIERALAHLVDQAHPLDHTTACTAQVHGLTAWPDAVGQLNDRHGIATLVQP